MVLHHKRRSEKILDILGTKELTGWEVTNFLFPRKLDSLNLRLAFQETLAHLKYLENKKVIRHNIAKFNTWEVIKRGLNPLFFASEIVSGQKTVKDYIKLSHIFLSCLPI